jgi:hypothetical protein
VAALLVLGLSPMPESEPDWDTILEQRAESERDHFFPVADEDTDFADEWDDAESSAYVARVEAGLEQEDSSDGK